MCKNFSQQDTETLLPKNMIDLIYVHEVDVKARLKEDITVVAD
jgi:hypothetical protein